MLRSSGVLHILGRQLVSSSVVSRNYSRLLIKKRAVALHSHCPSIFPVVTIAPSARHFGSSNETKKKKKQPKKLSKKARKRREKERNEYRKAARERERKLKRKKNLHPAAKMKRILSATDYWFSRSNLQHDHYLKEQLHLHKGYIPFKALLTFPKFHHWVDYQLLHDAYTCTAAEKRFQVVIDADLIEHGKEEAKRRKKEQAKEERERKKRAKKRRTLERRKRRERRKRFEERYEIVVEKVRQHLLEDHKKFLREEREEKEASEKAALLEEQSIRGFMERNREWMAPAISLWDGLGSLMKPPEEDDMALEDIDDEEVHDAMPYYEEEYWDFLYEEEEEENDLYFHLRNDEDIGSHEEDEDCSADEAMDDTNTDKKSDCDIDGAPSDSFGFDPLFENEADVRSQSKEEEPKTIAETVVGEEATGDTGAEREQVAAAGELGDLSHALVRHKRVTLAHLEELSTEAAQEMENEMSGFGYDPYGDIYYPLSLFNDEMEESTEETEPAKEKKPKQLPNYKTHRQVLLIQDSKKLKIFCDKLMESVRSASAAHGNNPNASAVGFDVEYCSLDLDIRGTLPAMLQLAGPGEASPIGLVWLDRFPDHGRKMLGNSKYESLLSILADPNILKVGVGASKDAYHLAAWWGVDDREHTGHFFSGITDLEGEDGFQDKSLAEICEAVLEKKLPKLKQKMTKKQKKRKKQGRRTPTSHWRTESITKQMKEYAANDVASGIDVWMKLKGLSKE